MSLDRDFKDFGSISNAIDVNVNLFVVLKALRTPPPALYQRRGPYEKIDSQVGGLSYNRLTNQKEMLLLTAEISEMDIWSIANQW